MNIEIGSMIKIENYSPAILSWCEKNLIFTNPTWETLKRLGKEDSIKRKRVPEKVKNFVKSYNTLKIPFGCLYGIWDFIKNENIKLNFNNNKDISIKNNPTPVELYDYQEDAVDFMVKAKGGVLVSPCGSGKTFMGIEIIHRIGKRFLWLVHTGDLLRQTYKEMKNLYPKLDIGFITEGKVDIGRDGCIATIQTLSNISPEIYKEEFDVVIADECSHCVGSPTISKMFSKILDNIPARYKYGLTATPSRADTMINTMYTLLGMSKDGKFDSTFKVDKNKIKTIIAEHKLYTLTTTIDFNKYLDVYEPDGTIKYNNLINFLSDNEDRNKEIINNVLKCKEEGRKQVVLCHRVSHCENLYKALDSLGLKVQLVIGKTNAKQREKVLSQQVDWDIIISTYALLKEGVNVKELDTLHLTTPQKDKAMIVQCVGRIERFIENKKQPIVYDYVDVNIKYCLDAYNKRKTYIKRRF